ncbi:hypothetical protein D6827_03390 [Candidatus Parcubacteria bacterium]|nr:MAG: hypothetical protein D6827_03390 [Candidatus Parcubacteria bacterium]
MKISWKFFAIIAFLLTTGAGCLSFSSDSGAGADGALWKTEDAGENWVQLATLPQASGVTSIGGVNVSDLEIDPSDPKAYYLSTYGNGLFYSYNAGNTWQRPSDTDLRSGTILKTEVSPDDECVIYSLTPSYLMKSENCGRDFSSVYFLDKSEESLTAMVLDWYNPQIVWLGDSTGTVIKTEDGGETWSTMGRFKRSITDIAVSNHDSRIIMVGTDGNGLYRSIDSGANWTEYEDELKKEYRDSDDVYGFTQTADGTSLIMNTKYGLLRSEDFGETWQAIPLITAPREVRIRAVAYDPESSLNIYYATDSTFYASENAGQAWTTQDLPSRRTPTEIVVHPKNSSYIYVSFANLEK